MALILHRFSPHDLTRQPLLATSSNELASIIENAPSVVVVLERFREDDPLGLLEAVSSPERVVALQRERRSIVVSLPVREYIADLVGSARTHPKVRFARNSSCASSSKTASRCPSSRAWS